MIDACKKHPQYGGTQYGCHAAELAAAVPPTPAPPTITPTQSMGQLQEAALMSALAQSAGGGN